MKQLPVTTTEQSSMYQFVKTMDLFNKRMRIDDYYGHLEDMHEVWMNEMIESQCEKLIVKVRVEDVLFFLQEGFVLEAFVERYFSGNNMIFMCKYFSDDRRNSDFWVQEDQILTDIQAASARITSSNLPPEYQFISCEKEDCEQLAEIYRHVFKIYPVPMENPEYIAKCMDAGSVFFAIKHGTKIVSAVCGEINAMYHNAEITDCATMPNYRQLGFMQLLISRVEQELFNRKIFCVYSIARARSFGMNATFKRLKYNFCGRLVNNCYIYEDLEDMNVWVKQLTAQK